MMLIFLAFFLVLIVVGTILEKRRNKSDDVPAEQVKAALPDAEIPSVPDAAPAQTEQENPSVTAAPIFPLKETAPVVSLRVHPVRHSDTALQPVPQARPADPLREKLARLEQLRGDGVITGREYKRMRKQVLSRF